MIDKQSTLFDITETYPETIPVFVSNGFPQMAEPAKRALMGKNISLSAATAMKKIDLDSFIHLLEEAVRREADQTDVTLTEKKPAADVDDGPSVVGILPCPVRIPMMERWQDFLNQRKEAGDVEIRYELQAASMGLEWVEKNIDGIDDPQQLPDLFISAGFDMFFDKHRFGRFRREGVFIDLSDNKTINDDFTGLELSDPEGLYSIVAVVPAMFLVNKEELGDIAPPRSWVDLLDPRFEKRVSLPVSDFDLFNAILLNIHKQYGDDGVEALGRSLLESMHPSQRVRSERMKVNKPMVTIMPYFFSKMVKEDGPLSAVWPEDGAILSPIFMLAKRSKADKLKSIFDFFASQEVGNLLARQGLFPSTHPDVENILPEGSRFMWLGWDYIDQHDLSSLISHCESLFDHASKGNTVTEAKENQ